MSERGFTTAAGMPGMEARSNGGPIATSLSSACSCSSSACSSADSPCVLFLRLVLFGGCAAMSVGEAVHLPDVLDRHQDGAVPRRSGRRQAADHFQLLRMVVAAFGFHPVAVRGLKSVADGERRGGADHGLVDVPQTCGPRAARRRGAPPAPGSCRPPGRRRRNRRNRSAPRTPHGFPTSAAAAARPAEAPPSPAAGRPP